MTTVGQIYKNTTESRGIVLEVINAIVMVTVAASYVVIAIIDTKTAMGLWGPYVVIEFLLSVWNLLTYYEKCKSKDGNGRRQQKS